MSAVAPNLLLDDDTWDLQLSDGNLVLSSGHDAARQAVTYRVRFIRGEWYADENKGIPYWTDIWVKNPNLPAIREVFRVTIAGAPGINGVNRIGLERSSTTREYSLSFVATYFDDTLLDTDGFAIGAP